jgi:hypothetical protein
VCGMLDVGYSGAAKTWYSVPGTAASDFEKVSIH